jgi:hypothetical protein
MPADPGGRWLACNLWDEVIAEFATEEEATEWWNAQVKAAAKGRKTAP